MSRETVCVACGEECASTLGLAEHVQTCERYQELKNKYGKGEFMNNNSSSKATVADFMPSEKAGENIDLLLDLIDTYKKSGLKEARKFVRQVEKRYNLPEKYLEGIMTLLTSIDNEGK